jgi:hypothetical protein
MDKKLTLSSVLEKFRGEHEKEASDAEDAKLDTKDIPVDDNAPEKVAEEAEGKDAEKVAEEATDTDTEKVAEDDDAKTETTDADVLKGIAKEAADNEDSLLKKEAGEFGKLFAQSFIDEVDTHAAIKQASDDAYAATVDTVNDMAFQEKLAEVQDEAYQATCAAIVQNSAYTTTVDSLQKEAGDNLPMDLAGVTQSAYDNTMKALADGSK